MEQILARYHKRPRNTLEARSTVHVTENPQSDVNILKEEITTLRALCLRMQGKGLEGLNVKELQQLEHELNEGILSVKDKKERVLLEQMEKSRLQEQKALMENERLHKEVEELRRNCSNNDNDESHSSPAPPPVPVLPGLSQEQSKQLFQFLTNLTAPGEQKQGSNEAVVSAVQMAGIVRALNVVYSFYALNQETRILDSGASKHMSSNQANLA
ncbi:hypothetical protein Cgig2_025905 [Carnegiea gigantea]|uniref:K-box domain-containing protein n=1 Tax=Carnegiea gigantea TaxID=171969 RepID=A0A9Q1K620_9CARY|nr:hypothetical protein Cgig2_025905 [Carnegiea gigantea]